MACPWIRMIVGGSVTTLSIFPGRVSDESMNNEDAKGAMLTIVEY